jgi:hypothetical protein
MCMVAAVAVGGPVKQACVDGCRLRHGWRYGSCGTAELHEVQWAGLPSSNVCELLA